ncbi:hypothetical protein LTR85_007613 [Meristemomyces frigidus]|nr:hypothetical protein LTR85_007613 [Meristemomyces frigidus]
MPLTITRSPLARCRPVSIAYQGRGFPVSLIEEHRGKQKDQVTPSKSLPAKYASKGEPPVSTIIREAISNITIIGAGLAGLSLALFSTQQDMKVTIYELRSPSLTTAGAIMLAPNALRSLDAIGVYDRIKATISIHGEAGAFVMAPQNPEGSELLGGIQYRTEDRGRAGWDSRVPTLDPWKSEKGRAVILGDATHAVTPAAGQGVNQAFEDVHSISLLLAAVNEGKAQWLPSLKWWQQYRQAGVERVTGLTNEMSKRMLPGWGAEGAETVDSSWLFGVQITDDVQARLSES